MFHEAVRITLIKNDIKALIFGDELQSTTNIDMFDLIFEYGAKLNNIEFS